MPLLGGGIDILNRNAAEASATPASESGTPSFLLSPILSGMPIAPAFSTSTSSLRTFDQTRLRSGRTTVLDRDDLLQ